MRRLLGQIFLSQESSDWRDTHCYAVSLPLLVAECCAAVQGVARVPQESQQVLQRKILSDRCALQVSFGGINVSIRVQVILQINKIFHPKINKRENRYKCYYLSCNSDGGGRTGTYCLIDMVLNRIAKGVKEIDVAATLEHIRDQRPGMLATKQQFEFVLKAVTEEIHATLKALPAEKSASEATSHVSPPASTKGEQ